MIAGGLHDPSRGAPVAKVHLFLNAYRYQQRDTKLFALRVHIIHWTIRLLRKEESIPLVVVTTSTSVSLAQLDKSVQPVARSVLSEPAEPDIFMVSRRQPKRNLVLWFCKKHCPMPRHNANTNPPKCLKKVKK